MTNTRITDPEILELRYPVILEKFSLRPNSGGDGAYHGGDGVIREMKFRSPMTLSILTERRSHNPPGLEGGLPGARGRNTLTRIDGRKINLGPKTAVPVYPGVSFYYFTILFNTCTIILITLPVKRTLNGCLLTGLLL